MTGAPEDANSIAAAGRGYMLAANADRERTIDELKAAFAQGLLTKEEFEGRIGWTFASRTYGELVTVTSDLAARRVAARPPRRPEPPAVPKLAPAPKPARRKMSHSVRWLAHGVTTPVLLVIAFSLISVHGDGGYGVVAFVIAFAYLMYWLSAGADMLWQWHSMTVPSAGMCVRCAHTAAYHRAAASCSVRLGALKMQGRCSCEGYLPPGQSPRKRPAPVADSLVIAATRR